MSRQSAAPPAARSWLLDGLASFAFVAIGLGGGKSVGRTLGVFGGLFFLAFTLGLGYWFGRTAWNNLLGARKRR